MMEIADDARNLKLFSFIGVVSQQNNSGFDYSEFLLDFNAQLHCNS